MWFQGTTLPLNEEVENRAWLISVFYLSITIFGSGQSVPTNLNYETSL